MSFDPEQVERIPTEFCDQVNEWTVQSPFFDGGDLVLASDFDALFQVYRESVAASDTGKQVSE